MDIVLTVNSPGEVAAWLTPAVRALRRRAPSSTITVCIPPCTFASGAEAGVVASLPEVDRVIPPKAFLAYLFFGRRPPGWQPGREGAVCFLGGDLLYAAWLARRLRYPALAYTEGRVQWEKSYQVFMVPDRKAEERALRSKAAREQVVMIGDLMLDAVEPKSPDKAAARHLLGIEDGEILLALFPGSRPFELQAMLPFFLRTVEIVAQALSTLNLRLQVLVSLSPFINPDLLAAAAAHTPPGMEGSVAEIRSGGGSSTIEASIPGVKTWTLVTGKLEVTAYQGCQYDCMLASDLALTVPGSNTMEMAYFGLPMVVAVPLNRAEDIPLEGLPGLIGSIPLVGPRIKKAAVHRLATRVRFTALPNRRAGQKVVPEVIGQIQPADLAIPLVELARQPQKRAAVSERLRQIAGSKGAAAKLAELVVETAEGWNERNGRAGDYGDRRAAKRS
ncbi:MAG TPA: hypothetical protein GXX29_06745 [Firmicutes bacterium]|nr:hypothetical protein [Bacillota bacterium]